MRDPGKFIDWMESSRLPLLADGAMGTLLNSSGIGFEQCFDALNLHTPGLVSSIHRAYIAAGSQLIETNTFGANRYKLAIHELSDQVQAINRSGVELARREVETSGREVLVAGDVGPLGVRLAPYGRVKPDQAREIFCEQIEVLAGAGIDLIILETFSDLVEIEQSVAAARLVCDLPVVASMTFTRDDRTLMGDSPEKVAERLWKAGVNVIGVNCSGGPDQLLRILRQMRRQVPTARYSAMPNAGWPEQVGGRIRYPAPPHYFGEFAVALGQAGACLIGGCCGTTPDHIQAMRQALDRQEAGVSLIDTISSPDFIEITPAQVEQPTEFAQKLGESRFVIAVEMDPPRGLAAQKLLAGASLLAEAGADVINVADSPMARMRMSPWAVCALIQQKFNLETVLHFPTRGRNLLRVQGDLLAAHALGIRNLFVVMGDPTEIGDYPEAMDNYDMVPSGLIRLIKEGFNLGIDHAGIDIGQPTAFFVGCALNPGAGDLDREIRNLSRKIRMGADFILTQPVFNPDQAQRFFIKYTETAGQLRTPVLAGILPLLNSRHAAFLHNEVPGIEIPEGIQQRLGKAGENVSAEGLRIAAELTEAVRPWASGIYLMPALNRFDLAADLIDLVKQA